MLLSGNVDEATKRLFLFIGLQRTVICLFVLIIFLHLRVFSKSSSSIMNRIWLGIAIATYNNTIFGLISSATPHWFNVGNDGSKGLWQICTRGVCTWLLSGKLNVHNN